MHPVGDSTHERLRAHIVYAVRQINLLVFSPTEKRDIDRERILDG